MKKGQVLATVVAPELRAQSAEAEAKGLGDKATFERLKAASQTPGAVAENEVRTAQATVQADQARLDSLRAMEQYLTVTAPFDGVITERDIHPGALVGPQGAGSLKPMLNLEEVERLRLTVPVPESLVGAITAGIPATFTVRSYPGVKFAGTVARIAHSIDTKTRTMAVELDVDNTDRRPRAWHVCRSALAGEAGDAVALRPLGGYRAVDREDVRRAHPRRRRRAGPVQRGSVQGDLVEVFGGLQDGDTIARRGSEELRNESHVEVRAAAPPASSAK